MTPIRDISSLLPGDVLYSTEHGFALVDDVDEAGAGLSLIWEDPEAAGPPRVAAARAVEALRLCVPGGFLARSVLLPDSLADMAALDPLRLLRLLLEDIGEPLDRAGVERWMVSRGLVPEEEFEPWWRALRPSLAGHPELRWDGRAVSLAPPEAPRPDGRTKGIAQIFLTRGQRARLAALHALPHDSRPAILEAAVTAGDIDAVLLLLRGWAPIPEVSMAVLRGLVRGGEARVAAALMARPTTETLDDLSKLASMSEGRVVLGAALERLPPTRRRDVISKLRQRISKDDSNARHFLEDALADLEAERAALPGAQVRRRVMNSADLGVPMPEVLPGEAFPTMDTTIDMRTEPGSIPLHQSGPLPAHRLLPMSLNLARALASRHANGQAGGLLGARLRPGGTIELGLAEDASPVQDVRDAMRLMADLAVGRRPPGPRVDDEQLTSHLAQLVPGAPLDWVTVLLQALSPDPRLRPRDGLDLWSRLERASALDRVRTQAPPRNNQTLQVAHDTHIGLLKSRLGQINQDAVFWYSDGPCSLLIVADGISVSTAGSGDLASTFLVRMVVAMWEQHRNRLHHASHDEIRAFLESALTAANQAICSASMRLAGGDLSQAIPMGTTCLVAVTQGATVHLATLGDSRAFLATANGVSLLTGDQNLYGEWLLSWQRGRPIELVGEGHALTGYCGHFNENGNPEPVPPQHRTVELLPGETLLLCSDGYTDYAADSMSGCIELFAAAARKDDLGEACRDLVGAANARGGGDNITTLLARLDLED